MRALIIPLALVSLAAQAQTAPLNDTGATQCVSGGALVTCSDANTGDAAPEPRQEARFGRDAAASKGQITKTGGGSAGFDFTPLDSAGNGIAIVAGVPASTPSCVHDNVTNLTWEVKTPANMNTTYAWADAAVYAATVNSTGLCGSHAPWRVPTWRELLSIVHYGTNSPAIDTNYFPNLAGSLYWTSDIYMPNPAFARVVDFYDGDTYVCNLAGGSHDFCSVTSGSHVRLVRSGQ